MSKDPAFLMYSSDWISGTQFMSMEERGAYITLIMAQHQHGPLDKKRLGFILGFDWVSLSDAVKEKFKETPEGLIFNERLENERAKRSFFVDKQRENGQKGGRPKKPKHNPNITQTISQNITQTKPYIEDVNENRNEDIIKDKKSVDIFEKIHLDVCEFFKITEMKNTRQFINVGNFVHLLATTDQLNIFVDQFENYKLLKNQSGYKHNIETFIGEAHNGHMDGAWNKENWKNKYDEFRSRSEAVGQSNSNIHGGTGRTNTDNSRIRSGDRGDKSW